MSGETLALETQLLLQEVTQAKQHEVVVDVTEGPPVSELEAAKLALLDKLRKKKDANRAQQQQLYEKRYGFTSKQAQDTTPEPKAPQASRQSIDRLTPVKAMKRLGKLPVASVSGTAGRHKKELLTKLRTQAVVQGAQGMAKLFGYSSYEEQIKKLNKLEKSKILQSEMKEKLAGQAQAPVPDEEDEDSSSDFADDAVEVDGQEDGDDVEMDAAEVGDEGDEDMTSELPQTSTNADEPVTVVSAAVDAGDAFEETQDFEALQAAAEANQSSVAVERSDEAAVASSPPAGRRRRNRVTVEEEGDGNDADSEEDGKDDPESDVENSSNGQKAAVKKDKAAAFRQLLAAEAVQNRKHKRLRQGTNFVESEAEEDEEEDVLKIGGLGDFGFGVPQAVSKESKDAEEERNALNLREDDLEGIVDDLSDDEREQEQDLNDIFRRETEEQDRQQVKEVMRNVKEGFGRNRRAFSNLEGGASARGRFNLDDLVAADGDKLEAARLGLLESDEDMNDDDEEEEDDKKEEENEEEDEEAEMERKLRERYLHQPKIYITSSESESEGENELENKDDEAVKEEIESDEERERQQIKQFSERARINRRMQRMKDLQRQIAKDTEEESAAPRVPHASMLLDEEDEESQSLMKVLSRPVVTKSASTRGGTAKETQPAPRTKSTTGPKIGRFNSFGMGSSVRSTSSFSRVVDNCKLFSAGSTTSTAKGFVFTSSFGSEKQGDENAAPDDENLEATTTPTKSKAKSTGASSSRQGKRPFSAVNGGGSTASRGVDKKRKSSFFSALSSYQCVSQSEPM